jgi:uroporphyrinogen decarboxylase
MTSRERIAQALEHREPDRVPYDLSGTTVTGITRNAYVRAMRHRGLSPEIGDAEVDPIQQIVTPREENLALLKSDTRRLGARRLTDYRESRRVTGDIIEVTDFYGCGWRFVEGQDLYFNLVASPLAGVESLSGAKHFFPRKDWTSYAAAVRRALDEQIGAVGTFCGVADRNTAGLTENSLRLRGYENWFVDTVVDPEGVEALLDVMVEDKLRYWDIVIDWALETGNAPKINVISEADDLGSQTATILAPHLIRKMIIPRFKTIFTHLKKRLPRVKIFMHSCGAVRELIPDLIEAGMDILNPVQFTAAGMDLEGLKRDFGDALTFWGGGVDTQSTLSHGTPRQVADEVWRIIDIMAPGAGFVFAPVHNVQDDVPPENFWAMWDTLEEHGKY